MVFVIRPRGVILGAPSSGKSFTSANKQSCLTGARKWPDIWSDVLDLRRQRHVVNCSLAIPLLVRRTFPAQLNSTCLAWGDPLGRPLKRHGWLYRPRLWPLGRSASPFTLNNMRGLRVGPGLIWWWATMLLHLYNWWSGACSDMTECQLHGPMSMTRLTGWPIDILLLTGLIGLWSAVAGPVDSGQIAAVTQPGWPTRTCHARGSRPCPASMTMHVVLSSCGLRAAASGAPVPGSWGPSTRPGDALTARPVTPQPHPRVYIHAMFTLLHEMTLPSNVGSTWFF